MSSARLGRRPAATLFVLAAAGAASGCGADRTTGPAGLVLDPTVTLNAMAGAARFGVAAGNGAGAAAVVIPGVVAGAGVSALNAFRNCAYQTAAQAVVCPPQTLNGYTLNLSFAGLDAAGAVLPNPTPATTEALRTVLTVRGTSTATTAAGQTMAVTLDQRQEATLRGLLSGTRVLDAVVTATSEVRTGGGTGTAGGVTSTLSFTQTTAGLVLPTDRAFPTAGTITTEVAAGGSGAPFVRQVLTFDGTGSAALVLTLADGTTRRCTLDLVAAATGSGGPGVRCPSA